MEQGLKCNQPDSNPCPVLRKKKKNIYIYLHFIGKSETNLQSTVIPQMSMADRLGEDRPQPAAQHSTQGSLCVAEWRAGLERGPPAGKAGTTNCGLDTAPNACFLVLLMTMLMNYMQVQIISERFIYLKLTVIY